MNTMPKYCNERATDNSRAGSFAYINKKLKYLPRIAGLIFIIFLDCLSSPATAENTAATESHSSKAITALMVEAKKGDAKSQYQLGLRYSTGNGVPKDKIQAYMWFQRAAEQGYTDAIYPRYELSTTMSKEEITEAKSLSSLNEEAENPQYEYYLPDSEGGKRIPAPPEKQGCYIYDNGKWRSATTKEAESKTKPVSCRTLLGHFLKNMNMVKNY